MNIAFVGCGFVFDIYMRTIRAHPELNVIGVFDVNPDRMARVQTHYGFSCFNSFDALLSDPTVEVVINLTNIGSHFDVSKQALEASKHVYSEKPLTRDLEQSRILFKTAAQHGVRLCAAPSNIYSDSVRTMFDAVKGGQIGIPRLIYAELDDNPISLMEFDKINSVTGAPWPLEEEIREGCTFEHVGYHLVWICALLGPAVSITALSNELLEDKSALLHGLSGTPDFSVALLTFACGAVARITTTVVAPRDHRMRIIGTVGEVSTDSYRHYQSPVFLERFSKRSLTARKFRVLRAQPWLGRIFGIGGSKLRLLKNWKSLAVERDQQARSSFMQRQVEWVRRRQVYAQDKLIGVAEMARDIRDDRPQYLTPEFLLHLNELTLIIHAAGPAGIATTPTTSFSPLGPIPGTIRPR